MDFLYVPEDINEPIQIPDPDLTNYNCTYNDIQPFNGISGDSPAFEQIKPYHLGPSVLDFYKKTNFPIVEYNSDHADMSSAIQQQINRNNVLTRRFLARYAQ